ncbi:uncharacterized oxidoreductase YeiQ-like [Saccostrea echinata]|uniref:uncharacterized oxidoreductase YeiQ-like n=1 Tax=Saccostrea echinata TaxID=191078 RepID=UPI002A7FCDE2|nr:uncharacterized oxidoreductase YeiQ-like [Saccostrea echinata]
MGTEPEYRVYPWTVRRCRELARCRELNVDGLICDDPAISIPGCGRKRPAPATLAQSDARAPVRASDCASVAQEVEYRPFLQYDRVPGRIHEQRSGVISGGPAHRASGQPLTAVRSRGNRTSTMPYIPASYPAQQLTPRIAHIGPGAFHRAQLAWACHELLQQDPDSGWGICALSLRGHTQVLEALEAQNYRYLLAIQGKEHSRVCEVGSIVRCLDAVRDGLAAVLTQLASADIISLTITEKGYCIHGADRSLDEGHPDIQHDLRLQYPAAPWNLPGALYCPARYWVFCAGHGRRQREQAGAPALLSCDNIPSNGLVLRAALLRFLELLELSSPPWPASLRNWVEEQCRFPLHMVDRITPAVSAQTLTQIAELAGHSDPIALATEEFSQWVIQDAGQDFPAGRPAWEQLSGVSIAASAAEVMLYEELKLRMLNGSHSFLAYCGYLAGKTSIFECMQDEVLRTACQRFITEEQGPTLHPPPGVDVRAYAEQLMERYSNPHILHRCHQIAMDGSLKIPQRWLDAYRTAAPEARQPGNWRFLSFGLAAWLQYLRATDLNGRAIAVQDPNAATLRQLLEQAPAGAEARALFSFVPTFGDLSEEPPLIEKVQEQYQKIHAQGLLPALSHLLRN